VDDAFGIIVDTKEQTQCQRTVAAADEGLPNSDHRSGLKDGHEGLSVARNGSLSPRTSVLPPDTLDEFLVLLDRYGSAEQLYDQVLSTWHGMSGSFSLQHAERANLRNLMTQMPDKIRGHRRDLLPRIREIRSAPAKSIDDILFKAFVADVVETAPIRASISYSIVRDLLASDCWRAAPGTRVVCINTRGCFSLCRCKGGHGLSPLVEGSVYIVHGFEVEDVAALAGYSVIVADVGCGLPIRADGYAPERFRVLETVRQQVSMSATTRAPVRVRELEA